jgi:PDZ domain-containing protein
VVVALAVVGAVLTLAAVGGLFIRVPYDTIAPGSARQVDDLIVVRDHPVYLAQGRVLFTTVSVREGINLWEVVGAWLDPDIDMVSEKDVRGTTPPDKYHELNVEAMADSKTAAEAVALRHLGFTGLDGGAQVVSVEPGLPASSVLAAKDVIVAVDGKPVTGPSGLVAAIGVHRPGDTLQLAVERDGAPAAERTATLATGDQGRPLLGVRLTTKLKLPFGVSIDSGNIEGPSAGLAYSLALLDRLTPGELTGGAKVAATGELGADGRVGAIGGVAQKVAAVRRSGATLFLVPRENYAEAEAHAGSHLRVAAIDTFDDALRAMGSLPGSNAASFAQAGGQGP